MKKVIHMVGVLLITSILLCACQKLSDFDNKPCNQVGTKWVSEDGTIVFYVDDSYHATGIITVDGEVFDVYMTNDTGAGMHVFPLSVFGEDIIDEKDKYEYWLCSFETRDKFIAIVKESTFYEDEQEIIFYRVEDAKSNTTDVIGE